MVFGSPSNFQGWKIHVTAPQTYELSDEYKQIFIDLQNANVPHKYVQMREFMRDEMNGHQTQKGKFLTIYPDDTDQLLSWVTNIDLQLTSTNFVLSPFAPGERKVGSKNLLTIRYGGLVSPFILDPDKLDEDDASHDIRNYQRDVRDGYKPDAVNDPFLQEAHDGLDGWLPREQDGVSIQYESDETGETLRLLNADRETIGETFKSVSGTFMTRDYRD